MPPILDIKRLSKSYVLGDRHVHVLNDITFSVNSGSSLAIVGPSGSGKSTLLGLCAGLELPTHGDIELDGELITALDEDQRSALRNRSVGFVFQSFQLISTLTALENVMVPMELRSTTNGALDRAKQLLQQVGLGERTDHYPIQLSGGEQQRVSLARAFINHPRILFADEPTGNLDAETGAVIEDLMFDLNAGYGTTLIIVTHNRELAKRTERVIQLRAGRIDHADIKNSE